MAHSPNLYIESSLPKPWEAPDSLQDSLYQWIGRAPWFAISLALHLLIYFVMAAIPWNELQEDKATPILAAVEAPVEELLDDPEQPIVEDLVPEPTDEPQLMDADLPDDLVADPSESNDSDLLAEVLTSSPISPIGLGAGLVGNLGSRGDGKDRRRSTCGGSGTAKSLAAALEWLKQHQNANGSWSAEGFSDNCGSIGSGLCAGPGNPAHDVGVSSLALLAFMGNGDTINSGKYRDVVARGVAYLKGEQDYDSGLIGSDSSRDFIYNHAIASLALCEAYYFSRSPLLRQPAQKAINYIARARNAYGAWRYDTPPNGDADTSVTGWMLFALKSAKDAKLVVDTEAFADGLAWLDEVTTPSSGHVGYDARGRSSSRTPSNEQFPRDKGEAMTAVGLLSRVFLGQDPDETILDGEKVMQNGADLLLTKLPEWDEQGFGCDMYYWYYGTYAMFQMGGRHWKRWNSAMKSTVLKNQIQSGDATGSWNPVGPWGHAGGRVYSTAMMTLCLEVYFRYGNVLGAR